MKILILGSLTNLSGSSLRNWELANAFATLGHQVTYSEPISTREKPKPLFSSVKYLPSPYYDLPFFTGFMPTFLYNSIHLIKNKYDVIITAKPFPHSAVPTVLFGKNSTKVLDIDDLEYEYHKGPIRYFVKFLSKFCIKIFPYYSTHNYPLKDYLVENFSLPSSKIFFLGQGINPETFKKSNLINNKKLTQKLNLHPKDIVILFFAHLGPASSLSTVLQSLNRIKTSKKYKLLVVGGGACLSKYVLECQRLKLKEKVIFVGHVEFQNRSDYFHLANFAVNYNVESGNEFRSPMKLREYLASELPVITSDIGDTKLFAKYVKIVTNEEDLVSSFQEWINHPPQPNILGKRYVVNHHSWLTMAQKFISQIEKISGKPQSPLLSKQNL